jgi:NADPH-dependent curcumin reductase CurA
MSRHNRAYKLARRPQGRFAREDFQLVEEPLPDLREGEALVHTLFLSLDPASRGWASEVPSYMPPVPIGDVMRGFGVGKVITTRNPALPEGALVAGMTGWQEYAVLSSDGPRAATVLPDGLPISPSAFLGVLGPTGYTAYFGLLDVAKIQSGETVVVSAAAGAVGSIAGQIAKIKGCRAIGIAGGADKCKWVTDELRFDACVDYKREDWRERLREATKGGVDVDFENVGGAIFDEVLARMKQNGRVALCGLISQYNNTERTPGPYNFAAILTKRLRVEGFIVIDYVKRFREAAMQLAQWMMEGKLHARETVIDGLEKAPEAVNLLFDGGNLGKLVVKVGDPR